MDKFTINKIVLITIALMIVFPVIINILMFISVFPVEGDVKTWISSLSSLWGAIIGGVISGALTLIGVKLSINASFDGIKQSIEHQEQRSIIETTGIKLNKLYEVKKIIFKTDGMLSARKMGLNENYQEDSRENIDTAIAAYLFPEFNNILAISASVDWEFYEEIKKFVDIARTKMFSFESSDLDELTIIIDALTETFEVNHEKRLIEMFKSASTKK